MYLFFFFYVIEQAITVASLIEKCSFEMRVWRKAKDFLEIKVENYYMNVYDQLCSAVDQGRSRSVQKDELRLFDC